MIKAVKEYELVGIPQRGKANRGESTNQIGASRPSSRSQVTKRRTKIIALRTPSPATGVVNKDTPNGIARKGASRKLIVRVRQVLGLGRVPKAEGRAAGLGENKPRLSLRLELPKDAPYSLLVEQMVQLRTRPSMRLLREVMLFQ